MKKLFVTILAIGMVAGMASSAFAEPGPSTETGKGKGTAGPADPSAGQDNQLAPLADAGAPVYLGGGGDPAAPEGAVGVAVGDEGAANSVGRAAVSGSADGFSVYAEDYTDGDQIANGVDEANTATTCQLIAETPCGPDDDDAVLVTISLA